MIRLTKESIVYVFAPSDIETGGIECAYSLALNYKQLGFKTKMVLIHPNLHPQHHTDWKHYINTDEHKQAIRIPEAYSKYISKDDVVFTIEDNSDNLIVIPEIWPDVLDNYKNIQKAIWWLSVDNGLGADQRDFHLKLTQPEYINVHHFYQSQYAYWFLLNHGAQYTYPLFDYINRDYIDENLSFKNRDNVILYNPKKGIEITNKLIEENPDLKFIPLQGMNREQLKELMLKSKMYIDFGHHPGKDKFPREAASCGCVIITSFKGSARFFNDVPIDSKYKFDDDIDGLRELIDDVFENFETHFNNFNLYRKIINIEPETFNNQIKNTYYEYFR
jgi:hypothetical protein